MKREKSNYINLAPAEDRTCDPPTLYHIAIKAGSSRKMVISAALDFANLPYIIVIDLTLLMLPLELW